MPYKNRKGSGSRSILHIRAYERIGLIATEHIATRISRAGDGCELGMVAIGVKKRGSALIKALPLVGYILCIAANAACCEMFR